MMVCAMVLAKAGDPPAEYDRIWCCQVWDPTVAPNYSMWRNECPRCRSPWWMWYQATPAVEAAYQLGGPLAVEPFMEMIIAGGRR